MSNKKWYYGTKTQKLTLYAFPDAGIGATNESVDPSNCRDFLSFISFSMCLANHSAPASAIANMTKSAITDTVRNVSRHRLRERAAGDWLSTSVDADISRNKQCVIKWNKSTAGATQLTGDITASFISAGGGTNGFPSAAPPPTPTRERNRDRDELRDVQRKTE